MQKQIPNFFKQIMLKKGSKQHTKKTIINPKDLAFSRSSKL